MLIGILAGFLSFGFAWTFGEPEVDRAIAFEEKMEEAHGHEAAEPHNHGGAEPAEAPAAHNHEVELVSRTMQSTAGLLTAVVVYGTAIGGLFALAFAVAYGRIDYRPRVVALLLAAAGFLVVVLVPALKYPPNPPSVGLGETIALRTEIYFLLILLTFGTLLFSVWVRQQVIARLGGWNATLVAGALFIAIISIAFLLLPTINEVPEAFSAVLLWRFRLASIGTQVILWTTLGLAFGALTERSLRQQL